MSELVFDIETDGLLDEMTKIHMIAVDDKAYIGAEVATAVSILQEADLIIGQNVICFDIPAIQRFFPSFKPRKVRDTKVMSQLIYPNLKERDFAYAAKHPSFPKQLIGRHSLEAWGYRLGCHKGTYGKTTDWKECTDEMVKYCLQDVIVTRKLYDALVSKGFSERAIELEHEFQAVAFQMECFGFPFNRTAAVELYTKLSKRRLELEAELKLVFPPWEIRTPFTPKVNNAKRGYVKGQTVDKLTIVEFNPSSRDHIAERLIAIRGWKPTEWTPSGKAEVSEDVLSSLPYPEAKLLSEYFICAKTIGQLAEGNAAWLKLEQDGRVHGRITTNIISGRCSHSAPNMAQVPGCDKPHGHECRALFTAPADWLLVGCDMTGAQLRGLSHYLTYYDSGEYRDVVLNGDIHTKNQQAAGLPTRAIAKTWIYALLMGAGDLKLGEIAGGGRALGTRLKTQFLKAIPALAKFRSDLESRGKARGYLVGLDGRHIPVRDIHATMSFLLQNFEAVLMKWAMAYLTKSLESQGMVHGRDWGYCAMVHDEVQIGCRPDLAMHIGVSAVGAIEAAGVHFNTLCPVTGDFRVGRDWAETH